MGNWQLMAFGGGRMGWNRGALVTNLPVYQSCFYECFVLGHLM